MKKLLFGTFLLALGGPAIAADMPVKAPVAVSLATNWSGFYVGAGAGYLTGTVDGTFVFPPPATWHIDHQAGVLDGHVGAQIQFANIVVGAEADLIDFFDKSGSPDTCHPAVSCGGGTSHIANLVDHMWTAGGRAGLVSGSSLFYVSGGYAGGAKVENDVRTSTGALFESTTTTHTGTYFGGGFDWMVNPHLIVGAEYRHYEFGSQTAVPTLASGAPFAFDTWTVKPKADTISLRMSWFLGWAGGSLMSKN